MAQYLYYLDPDTGLQFRDGVRGGKYVIDKELDATGFDGVEDTNWENLEEHE